MVLSVTGISFDRQWLQVRFPIWERRGWLYAALTDTEGTLATLPTVTDIIPTVHREENMQMNLRLRDLLLGLVLLALFPLSHPVWAR